MGMKFDGIKRSIEIIEKYTGFKAKQRWDLNEYSCPILRLFHSDIVECVINGGNPEFATLWYPGGHWWRSLSCSKQAWYTKQIDKWLAERGE